MALLQIICLLGIVPLLYFDRIAAHSGGTREQDELGTNLTLGAIVILSNAAVLAGFAFCYARLQPHVALLPMPPVAAQLALAVVLGDFASYWHHRMLHRMPFLWASHIVHHQSRHIDLSTGLRNHPFTTISLCLSWSPLLVLGVSPAAMLAAAGIIGAWDVLIHGRRARQLPAPAWLGSVLNLPSHHLMHHGDRQAGEDCNFGLLLIVWDRLFGTFREPRPCAAFGVDGEPAVAPTGRLLWNQWRLMLGWAPSGRSGEAGPSAAAGLLAWLGAVAATAMIGAT